LTPLKIPWNPDLEEFFDTLDNFEQQNLTAKRTIPPTEFTVLPIVEPTPEFVPKRRSHRIRPLPRIYTIYTKKDFLKNNVDILLKANTYIDDEIIIHFDLANSFIFTIIQPDPEETSKASYLL